MTGEKLPDNRQGCEQNTHSNSMYRSAQCVTTRTEPPFAVLWFFSGSFPDSGNCPDATGGVHIDEWPRERYNLIVKESVWIVCLAKFSKSCPVSKVESVGTHFFLCAPASSLIVPVVTVPFSDVNVQCKVVFSERDCEFVEPQKRSKFGDRDEFWRTTRESRARSGQKQAHAAKHGVQSSTRIYEKHSAAGTRRNAFTRNSDLAWSTEEHGSRGERNESGRREPAMNCAWKKALPKWWDTWRKVNRSKWKSADWNISCN